MQVNDGLFDVLLNDDQAIEITLTAKADTTIEGLETVRLSVYDDYQASTSDPKEYVIGSPSVAEVGIEDIPVVSVEKIQDGSEDGNTPPVLRVRRTGSTSSALPLYFTLSGTATAESDYTSPGQLQFSVNEDIKLITVPVRSDNAVEGEESIELSLVSSSSYAVNPEASSAVVVVGDDPPVVSISVADAAATEQGPGDEYDPGSFSVTRTGGDTSTPIAVTYTFGGTATQDVDYSAGSGTIHMTISGTIHIVPIDDPDAEDVETITAEVTASPGVYLLNPVLPLQQQPATLPASQPVNLGDNVSISSVTVSAEPMTNQPAIYNAFNGYGFVARITLKGEMLSKIEASQDLNSSTAMFDYNGNAVPAQQLQNLLGAKGNSNGWIADPTGGQWGQQAISLKPNSNESEGYFFDNQALTLTPATDANGNQIQVPYNGQNVLIAPIFYATRYMRTKFREIGKDEVVEDVEWGFKWNNSGLLWSQNDPLGNAPVPMCARQGGAGLYYEIQAIAGL